MAQLTISSYPVSYTTNGSLRGTNYQNAIGKGADTSAVSGNDYCSSRNSYANIYYAFDFSELPDSANIISVACQVKGHAESTSQSAERARCQLYVGTSTAKGSYSNFTSTSAQTLTLTTGSWTYDEVQDMRLCFTVGYYGGLVNGATVTITYEAGDPRTITSTLSGNGTISPSGAIVLYDGEYYELTITPTNISDTVTVTNNNVDVTSELVEHHSGGTSTSYSTASGSGVTTGFARSGGAFYQSSSTSSDSWLRYAIGHTAESPYSTSNTNNTYCKDGTNDATTQGWMNYPFSFSSLPDDAEVTAVEVKCYGAAESTSESARHADVSLWCGNEQKGTTQRFTSTSNTTMTISDPGEWTREELQDAWVRFGVGYYGGRILGITWKVTYTYGGTLHHYTYSYEVNGDATIAVTIGSPTPGTQKIYVKEEGTATLLYTNTNTDSDNNIQSYISTTSEVIAGDTIRIVLSNIYAYSSGRPWVSILSDDITTTLTTLTSGQRVDVGSNDIKVRIGYYSANRYSIRPYYQQNGYDCTFTGTMSIYKLDSSGGWVQYSKVYKKINGSWVEQASSTWATLFNTNTNYRKME